MTQPTTVERQPPEAAFESLAGDLRVGILQALGSADEPLSFSELRAAVGEADSGKFNYHLGKLVGHFVRKSDEGYDLSIAGSQAYGAIRSGAYTADATVEPFEFDGPCPVCDSPTLEAAYTDELATLSCPECEEWENVFPFPPANLDQYDRADLPAAFDAWMYGTVARVLRGFCANCGGRVAGELTVADDGDHQPVRAVFDCDRCGDTLRSSAVLPAVFHPRVVAAFDRQGADVLSDPSWVCFARAEGRRVELVSQDPVTATVTIEMPGETLVATIGPDATVEDVTVERPRSTG